MAGLSAVAVRDWLKSKLTRRVRPQFIATKSCKGLEKWYNSRLELYETLRIVLHENVLPASERLTVDMERLVGYAELYVPRPTSGILITPE
jgi:hypothetical protein